MAEMKMLAEMLEREVGVRERASGEATADHAMGVIRGYRTMITRMLVAMDDADCRAHAIGAAALDGKCELPWTGFRK